MRKQSSLEQTPKRLSLVTQTVKILREGLLRGRWLGQLPSERDLAADFQISRDTLRSALAEMAREGWFKPAQRQRRTINKPTPLRPRHRGKLVLGILSPIPFYDLGTLPKSVVDRLRLRLAEMDCELSFQTNRVCFSERPEKALQKLTHSQPADGWMILGSREPMQRWFVREGVPCFVLGSCGLPESIGSLDADFRATGRHAGALLLRKGHRRIALVISRGRYGGELECEQGLREAIAGRHDARLQVLASDMDPTQLRQLLERSLRGDQPPTAYIVGRPQALLSVVTHLLVRGRRIPKDVAVICCQDSPDTAWLSPKIARYIISAEVFVRHAVDAARALLTSPSASPRTLRLMPEFFKGETV
jgi:DNA-binding LacI/PurR family transcriptional regulator